MNSLLKFQSALVSSFQKKSLVCRVEYSPFVFQLLKILRRSGFIYGFQLRGLDFFVYLRYLNGTPSVTESRLISKPGSRVFVKATELRRLAKRYPHAVHVVSTKLGLRSYPIVSLGSKKTTPTGEYLLRLW